MVQNSLNTSSAGPPSSSSLGTPQAPSNMGPEPLRALSTSAAAAGTCEPVASSSPDEVEACTSSGGRVHPAGGSAEEGCRAERGSAGSNGQDELGDQAPVTAPSHDTAADRPAPPPDKALDPTQHRPSAPQVHGRNFGGLGS